MIHGAMKLLKTGDPCPCCGQPIRTRDPETLYLLTWIKKMQRFPIPEELDAIRQLYRNKVERERNGGANA